MGYGCGGYRPVPTKSRKKKKQKQALGCSQSFAPPNKTPAIETLAIKPLTNQLFPPEKYDAPTEVALFHHVRTCMIQEFTTALAPNDFWYKHALPRGHSVKPVRAALCALGSAHKLFKMQHAYRDSKVPTLFALEEFAMQQYNEAIRNINLFSHKESKASLDIVLICCIIFICIENLFGRDHEAVRHIRAAHALFVARSRLDRHANARVACTSSGDDGFLDDIQTMLMGFCHDTASYVGYGSIPELGLHSTPLAAFEKPSEPFESLDAAARSFRILQMELQVGFVASPAEPGQFAPKRLTIDSALRKSTTKSLVTYFNGWSSKFDALRETMDERHLSDRQRYQVQGLSIYRSTIPCFLDAKPDLRCLPADFCEDVMQKMEALADSRMIGSGSTFSFDGCLLSTLTLLATACRDVNILKRAASLLRCMNRREGLWSSQECADFVEGIIHLRENHAAYRDGFPWNQWFVTAMSQLMSSVSPQNFTMPPGVRSLVSGIK